MLSRHYCCDHRTVPASIGDREFGSAPADLTGGICCPIHKRPILPPRVAGRPRCPKCQSRMEIQHIASARSGFEHWTLRCTKCWLIHEAQVNTDPMKSNAIGLEHSDLRAPQ